MTLTKQDMEEMWRTGPIDALKSHIKKYKNTKHYSVRIRPYSFHEVVDIEVTAKSAAVAQMYAREEFYKTNGKNYDGLSITSSQVYP